MLPRLQAEQQLLAIEVAAVPHMKPEEARKVMRRYRRQLEGVHTEKKSASDALLDAFQQAGFPVVHEPVKEVTDGG